MEIENFEFILRNTIFKTKSFFKTLRLTNVFVSLFSYLLLVCVKLRTLKVPSLNYFKTTL